MANNDVITTMNSLRRVCGKHNCPLASLVGNTGQRCSQAVNIVSCSPTQECFEFIYANPSVASEMLQKWITQNPFITNADKFAQVFGYFPNPDCCPRPCDSNNCSDCPRKGLFWDQEYINPRSTSLQQQEGK